MMGISLRKSVEELLIVAIIIMQVMEFFDFLPGDVQYIEKIISMVLLGYLIYVIDISSILFGAKQKKWLNSMIIISFFMLFIKDLVAFAMANQQETALFNYFFQVITSKGPIIEALFFYLGGILLTTIALFITFTVRISRPSFMSVVHEDGSIPITIAKSIERFLSVFFVLIIFFLFVFNLLLEWLGIAIDTPLMMFAILLYLFIIARYHKRFGGDTLIYKIGNFGEKFYIDFIALFHSREKVYLGVSGLLIFHLLTDIGIFFVPYITGIKDLFYYASLNPMEHVPFLELLIADAKTSGAGINLMYVIWVHLFNMILSFAILILPAIIWYNIYQKKGFDVHHVPLAMFFSALLIYILAPTFRMLPIQTMDIVGVDFITFSLFKEAAAPLSVIFFLSLAFGIMILLLSYFEKVKKVIIALGIIAVNIFLGIYVYYFFTDIFFYYTKLFVFLVKENSEFFISSFFLIFMTFTVIFYIFGYLVFLKETYQEYKVMR